MNYAELKDKLDKVDFDRSEIQLDACTIILDQSKFYKMHCSMLEGNKGNRRFMPYFERLTKFYKYYQSKN